MPARASFGSPDWLANVLPSMTPDELDAALDKASKACGLSKKHSIYVNAYNAIVEEEQARLREFGTVDTVRRRNRPSR